MNPVVTFIQPALPLLNKPANTARQRQSEHRQHVNHRRSRFITSSPSTRQINDFANVGPSSRRLIQACTSSDTNQNSKSGKQPEYTPVEDGVVLPEVKGGEEELRSQSGWLEIELRNWLDFEWPDNKAARAHNELAHRAAQLYERLRAEGINDVGTLMLGIGTAMEGEDFSKTYVGAWNIANKFSDLLIQRFAPGRLDDLRNGKEPQSAESTWSILKDPFEEEAGTDADGESSSGPSLGRRRAASPSLADGFERYRFLQMVLDGSAKKPLIDGAVAVAMGFEYNMSDGTWSGAEVTDAHFKQFGDIPPDILGDEFKAQWTDTLKYMDEQVKADDEDGRKEEGLNVVIETLHGMEMTKIQTNDEHDHSFHKRLAVAKWLHLLGGF